MYSLTIHFGPNAMVWSFLFKEKVKAEGNFALVNQWDDSNSAMTQFHIVDDFGRDGWFTYGGVHGALLEDLEQSEAAKIQLKVAEERFNVKWVTTAKSDPAIAAAIRQQQSGPGVLTPFRQ